MPQPSHHPSTPELRHRAPPAQRPGAPGTCPAGQVGALHQALGNAAFGQATLGPDPAAGTAGGGFDALVGGAAALALAGVSHPAGPGAGSNQATAAVMRKATGAPEQPAALQELRPGGGQALPPAVRERLERVFGQDLGSVRVHVGPEAARLAHAAGAHAFTLGEDIWFGEGEFAPGTAEGDALLMHELVHVLQGREGRLPSAGGLSAPEQASEREAEAEADRLAPALYDEEQALVGEGLLDEQAWADAVDRAPSRAPARQIACRSDESLTGPPEAAPAGPRPPEEVEGAVAWLTLFVDVSAELPQSVDLAAGRVGHAWVALQYMDSRPEAVPTSIHPAHRALLVNNPSIYADPFGFYPAKGYSADFFNSYVAGGVAHPDDSHQGRENATQTWEVDEGQVLDVIAYAQRKRNADYSLYFHNCVHFALGAVGAAGLSGPTLNLPILCPNDVYEALVEDEQDRAPGVQTRDVQTEAHDRARARPACGAP